jgi:hypothetical protein
VDPNSAPEWTNWDTRRSIGTHGCDQSTDTRSVRTPREIGPTGLEVTAVDASTYLRAVTPLERDLADERILASEQVRFIDADESAGRRAHLANVRTVGELAAVVDDLPDLGDLRLRRSTAAAPPALYPGPPPGPVPGNAVATWAPGTVPEQRTVRLPLTSPGREDAPPPDLPYGPYGDQFATADPRVLSHRVVTRVVPTAWGPTWQTVVVSQTNRMAVISLVCGLVALACVITAPVGVVTGHLALAQIKRSDLALAQGTVAAVGEQPQQGRGMAIAGLILSYLFVALGLALLVAVIVSVIQQS